MNITRDPLTVTVDFATPLEARAVKAYLNCWGGVLANATTRRFELVLTRAEFARFADSRLGHELLPQETTR
jgi:hypothetical protein